MRWLEIFRFWKSKDPLKINNPGAFKDEKKMPWNIYNDKTMKEHAETFHRVHWVWKYKFLVPVIHIGEKVLGKYLLKKIPDKPYNRNLIIFDKAFERSMFDWNIKYRRQGGPDHTRKSFYFWKKATKVGCCNQLRIMKEFMITMCHQDTAYREFFNILMHNLAHDMVKEYGNKKKYPKGVGHLFYADGTPYDVHYYVLFKWVEMQGKVQWRDVHEYIAEYERLRLEKKRKWKTESKTANQT